MESMIDANRTARAFAGRNAESYRQFAESTVGLQERNVRFWRDLFEAGTREARRQTEANLALTQKLFEQAEEQGEVLRKLTESATRAYWGALFSSAGYFGNAVPRVSVEVKTAPASGEVQFPIPGYAKLTSAQAIEKLDGLSVEELKKVRAYEMEHKNRKTLLAQIEQRIQAAR